MSAKVDSHPYLVASPRGGLGNQLFNLAATLSVATRRGWDVKVDLRQTAHMDTRGGHSIEDILPSRYVSTSVSVLPHGSRRFIGSRSLRRGLARRLPPFEHFLKAHSSRTLGYDASLLNVGERTRVYGYYHTYRYVETLDEDELKRALRLRTPTPRFHQLKNEIMVESPIVAHVRRGDYASNGDFGLLGPKYYTEALAILEASVGKRPIWVFSDDPLKATSVLPRADRFIGPEVGAAETLMLMSQGSGLISANSSLSWWAGWLSGYSRHIVAPNPWFAEIELDSGSLLPPHWTRLPPYFISHAS